MLRGREVGTKVHARTWRRWDRDIREKQIHHLHTEDSPSPKMASGSGISHPHFPRPTRCCCLWSRDCTLRTTVLEPQN